MQQLTTPPAFEADSGALGLESRTLTVAAFVAVQAELGRPAFLAPNRKPLDYAGLLAQMDHVKQALAAAGIGRGDRVAIVLPNGADLAVTAMAVCACATAAPLNPAYREAEFDFYMGDVDAKALIILKDMDSPARIVAAQRNMAVLELEPDNEGPTGTFRLHYDGTAQPAANAGWNDEDDVALVLHTSGTTSRPKIVPLVMAKMCEPAQALRNRFGLTADDCSLSMMPLFHVHGLVDVTLASLSIGASVVFLDDTEKHRFFDWFAHYRPTWYSSVPTFHQQLLKTAPYHQAQLADHRLRFVRTSSAPMPGQALTALSTLFDVPVYEAYGMTEAITIATTPAPPARRRKGSVGTSTLFELAILDEAGQPLPANHSGEVAVRGRAVLSGYENNPEANAKAFTADGFFRTGDRGFMDKQGYVFLQGRINEVINRAGEKVSPHEVDQVLLQFPGVTQVATFPVTHELLGQDVAAAVVAADGVALDAKALRQFAGEKLADYKVPRQILIVDEIPKGPTGKLKRIDLAEKLGLV